MNMSPVISNLITNYDAQQSKTWVNLPSTFALHPGIESLVICGFISPYNIEWVWQYGKIYFGMDEKQFRSLNRRAHRYYVALLAANRKFEKNNAKLRKQQMKGE